MESSEREYVKWFLQSIFACCRIIRIFSIISVLPYARKSWMILNNPFMDTSPAFHMVTGWTCSFVEPTGSKTPLCLLRLLCIIRSNYQYYIAQYSIVFVHFVPVLYFVLWCAVLYTILMFDFLAICWTKQNFNALILTNKVILILILILM